MLADGPSSTKATAFPYNDEVAGVMIMKKLNSHAHTWRNVLNI